MSDQNAKTLTQGKGIPLPGNDIDTDQIIPARFMKCVTFDGLGAYAFYDSRYTGDGTEKEHPFNDVRFKDGSILLVNKNFGCGSSREHAPQSLMRYGIRAIIGESFAEIFLGNCTAMGIPAVIVTPEDIQRVMEMVNNAPEIDLAINLEEKCIQPGEDFFPCDLPESSREALIKGTWDSTAQLLANKDKIEETAKRLPYMK